jgi:putative NADPH-quinone reductase
VNVLVVFCHPVPDSYGASLRDVAVSSIANDRVHHVDLYSGQDLPRCFTEADAADLRWADAVVLVYPTWWSSLPAPLMAWIEEGLERDAWRHLHRVVAVTTHGSSRLVNMVTGGIGQRIVRRGLPQLMAPGSFGRFIALYSMDRIDDEKRREFAATLPSLLASALK